MPAGKTKRRSSAGGRFVRGIVGFLGVLALIAGVVILGGVAFFPNETSAAFGEIKTSAQSTVEDVTGDVPEVGLGETGRVELLDICDDQFYGMESYQVNAEIIPVYAAHNNCGGDVVLAWDKGDRIQIDGDGHSGLYEVVDVRITPKTWATTADLVGLQGEFALQSCYYGVDEMRFLGLAPVGEEASA